MSDVNIPIGFKFCPLDSELVIHYLYNKVIGNPLPYEGVVTECDLYGKREPWEIFETSNSNKNVVYFFTKLKKKSRNGCRIDRTVGSGTWKGQDSGSDVFDHEKTCIGRKKMLVFEKKAKGSANNKTRYIMHEFSLAGYLLRKAKCDDIVICRIRKKEDKNEKNSRQSETDDMVINFEDYENLESEQIVDINMEENKSIEPEKVEHFSDLIKIESAKSFSIEETWSGTEGDQQPEHFTINLFETKEEMSVDMPPTTWIPIPSPAPKSSTFDFIGYDETPTWGRDEFTQLDTKNVDFHYTDFANNIASELMLMNQQDPLQEQEIDMLPNMNYQYQRELGN